MKNSESAQFNLIFAQIILAMFVVKAINYGIATVEFPMPQNDNSGAILAELNEWQRAQQRLKMRALSVGGFATLATGVILNITGLIVAGIFLFISALLVTSRLSGLVYFFYYAGLIVVFLVSVLLFFIKSPHKPKIMISVFAGLLLYSLPWSRFFELFFSPQVLMGQEFLPLKFLGAVVLVVGLIWYILAHQQRTANNVLS